MDTTFQPQVRVSDKTQWTNTELLLDMLRMLNEMIAQLHETTQRVEQSTKKLDGPQ